MRLDLIDVYLLGISSELSEIIKAMMSADYRLRPSVNQLLSHPFIRRIECSRRWKLKSKRSLKLAKTLLNWFLQFFINTFLFICYPFKYLYQTIAKRPATQTPFKSPNNSNYLYDNDFDNYSDDDLFDASSVSLLNNSDKSSQSEDKQSTASSVDHSFDIQKYFSLLLLS